MDNFNVAKIAKDNVKSDDWLKVKRKLDFSSANEPPPEGTNLRREIIERMVKVPTAPQPSTSGGVTTGKAPGWMESQGAENCMVLCLT